MAAHMHAVRPATGRTTLAAPQQALREGPRGQGIHSHNTGQGMHLVVTRPFFEGSSNTSLSDKLFDNIYSFRLEIEYI